MQGQSIARLTTVKKSGQNHAVGISLGVEGLDELMRDFMALGEDAVLKLAEPSVEAATVVMEKARSNIHDITGTLSSSLKVTKPGTRQRGHAYVVIATVGFSQKKMNGSGGSGYYGAQLELGHKLVIRGKTVGSVAGHPFLRPAADSTKEQVVGIMTDAMNDILNEFGKKDGG
jgi:HK97 gp10 family phage protein